MRVVILRDPPVLIAGIPAGNGANFSPQPPTNSRPCPRKIWAVVKRKEKEEEEWALKYKHTNERGGERKRGENGPQKQWEKTFRSSLRDRRQPQQARGKK